MGLQKSVYSCPNQRGKIYQTGKRGDGRVVWSNDGLIFVSYDHYKTFYEIV
jgi:hypothetical protein